jgi:hypothetical protein
LGEKNNQQASKIICTLHRESGTAAQEQGLRGGGGRAGTEGSQEWPSHRRSSQGHPVGTGHRPQMRCAYPRREPGTEDFELAAWSAGDRSDGVPECRRDGRLHAAVRLR